MWINERFVVLPSHVLLYSHVLAACIGGNKNLSSLGPCQRGRPRWHCSKYIIIFAAMAFVLLKQKGKTRQNGLPQNQLEIANRLDLCNIFIDCMFIYNCMFCIVYFVVLKIRNMSMCFFSSSTRTKFKIHS